MAALEQRGHISKRKQRTAGTRPRARAPAFCKHTQVEALQVEGALAPHPRRGGLKALAIAAVFDTEAPSASTGGLSTRLSTRYRCDRFLHLLGRHCHSRGRAASPEWRCRSTQGAQRIGATSTRARRMRRYYAMACTFLICEIAPVPMHALHLLLYMDVTIQGCMVAHANAGHGETARTPTKVVEVSTSIGCLSGFGPGHGAQTHKEQAALGHTAHHQLVIWTFHHVSPLCPGHNSVHPAFP